MRQLSIPLHSRGRAAFVRVAVDDVVNPKPVKGIFLLDQRFKTLKLGEALSGGGQLTFLLLHCSDRVVSIADRVPIKVKARFEIFEGTTGKKENIQTAIKLVELWRWRYSSPPSNLESP